MLNNLIADAVKSVCCCSLAVFLLYVQSLQKKLPYLQFQFEAYESGGILGCGIAFLRLRCRWQCKQDTCLMVGVLHSADYETEAETSCCSNYRDRWLKPDPNML